MKFIILALFVTLASCGHIQHNEKATSYQNFQLQHYKSVPTYVKKEDQHLLHHPVSKGHTSSNIQVHHGDKHDHGYAYVQSQAHGQEHEGYEAALQGHGAAAHAQYEVQDHGEDQQQQYVQYVQPEELAHAQTNDHQAYQTVTQSEYRKLLAEAQRQHASAVQSAGKYKHSG